LSFRVDNRIKITAPAQDSTLSFPFTLRWTVKDFDVVQPGTTPKADSGYFAVFVDTTPMRPGQTLEDLAKKDATCHADQGCPSVTYYNGRGIYTTSDTSATIAKLPEGSDGKSHRATIVLLDGAGHRIGESAFRINFQVKENMS
jgi:hypothetical protein